MSCYTNTSEEVGPFQRTQASIVTLASKRLNREAGFKVTCAV